MIYLTPREEAGFEPLRQVPSSWDERHGVYHPKEDTMTLSEKCYKAAKDPDSWDVPGLLEDAAGKLARLTVRTRVDDDHLSRLQAMTDDKGETWDLSDNDRAALAWAVELLQVPVED